MLDIGAGEGYALAFFDENGWEVSGIDLSIYGLRQHNPNMEQYLIQGDFEDVVGKLVLDKKKFDFINADNVLEHVTDPEKFFELVSGLCHKNTVICTTVPNDFSMIQLLAHDMGMIEDAFWVTRETSEHFSYFTVDSLSALGEGNGFKKVAALSDLPIDFFLLNPYSNYKRKAEVGHDCHVACAWLENRLYEQSIDKTVSLFESMADAGIGREISVFFKPNNK